jgi:sugar/nucleoside kinase (ribokinase family)
LTPSARVAQNASSLQFGSGGPVEQHEVERIARATLKELGVGTTNITVTQDPHPGQWRVEIQGSHAPLKIKCGQGSTAQWVRAQIFEQYLAQS